MPKVGSLRKRFEEKVAKTEGCWIWIACKNSAGYGTIKRGKENGGGMAYAHRVSYELFNGQVPEGACVLHSCDNPSCVNPAHLRVGNQSENIREMYSKGRCTSRKKIPSENVHSAKLTKQQVIEIREKYRSRQVSMRQMSRDYAVSHSTIAKIVHFRGWKE